MAQENSQISFSNSIGKQNYSIELAKTTQEQLQKIISSWPQVNPDPSVGGTIGFLPSVLLQPNLTSNTNQEGGQTVVTQTFGNYNFVDWRGQKLNLPEKSLKTGDRFYAGKDLPRENRALVDKPYSMRDVPLIFGDGRLDYFRHGLQVIGDGRQNNDLTPIENPVNGSSDLRLDRFKETPWENEDPPMFGFDIIIDSASSPLLNGSLNDFIVNYSNVSEIASKKQVYEEFKNQFQKFFRLTNEITVDKDYIAITSLYSSVAAAEGSSTMMNPHKKNYLGHYIKKISGLDFLIEQNKGDAVKYLPEYKKDFITLDLREDVSMNIGTLAHLYKTLYWSRPNGKMLIPENLLRFNCMIIISECRNFQRVKKGIKNPENLYLIKDNLSRYVYTLRECQFYFDKLPLDNEVDLGDQGPKIYENYQINFDFKYSTVKLERFVPNGDWGNYVGIDGGAIWKVGNKGTRNQRGQTGSQELSTPRFFTVGPDNENYSYYPNLKINGEDKPFIMTVYGPNPELLDEFSLAKPKSSEGTIGGNNQGSGGQNLGQLGAGSDITTQIDQTTGIATEGSTTGTTITQLENQSKQATEQAKQQSEISSVEKAVSSQKKITSGLITEQISNANLSKITKNIGTPLSQIVANKSVASETPSGGFFDKMGSLKIGDSLKNINTGGLSSLGENLSSNLGNLKTAIPSLDDVKSKFSQAKSQATTGFFDVRGNLKSSLTDAASKSGSLFGGLSNQSGGLLSGLTEKAKSAIPSLDSVKTQFSAAKSQATTGFFDVRGNLKSSLTEGSGGLFGKSGGLLGGLGDQASGLLGGITDKAKGGVPSLDSVKTQFSAAKSQATTGFFDVRGNLKSSLTEGAGGLFGKSGGLLGGLGEQASGLLGGLTDKVKGGVPSLDSVKTQFSAAKSQATTGFFDIRGNLKESLTQGLTKNLTSFDKEIEEANSLGEQISKKKNGSIDLIKGILNKEVEEAKNTVGNFVSVDNIKNKFSNAVEIPSSAFFDVRSQISGEKGKDTSSLNLRKNLLNDTISKIYNTQKSGNQATNSNTPPATSFFDLKNQLKDFLGGQLGDKLTE